MREYTIPESSPDELICNGQLYVILGKEEMGPLAKENGTGDPLYRVRRPKGVIQYAARRLPDHPLYGENRGQILFSLGRKA